MKPPTAVDVVPDGKYYFLVPYLLILEMNFVIFSNVISFFFTELAVTTITGPSCNTTQKGLRLGEVPAPVLALQFFLTAPGAAKMDAKIIVQNSGRDESTTCSITEDQQPSSSSVEQSQSANFAIASQTDEDETKRVRHPADSGTDYKHFLLNH